MISFAVIGDFHLPLPDGAPHCIQKSSIRFVLFTRIAHRVHLSNLSAFQSRPTADFAAGLVGSAEKAVSPEWLPTCRDCSYPPTPTIRVHTCAADHLTVER